MNKKTVYMARYTAVCFFLAVSLWSCAARQMMVNEMAGIIGTGVSAFEADDDLDMLEKAMPANIKLLETLLESSPENSDLLVLLSRLYGSYAFVFFEGKLEKAKLMGLDSKEDSNGENVGILAETVNRYYRKGMEFALRALEAHHGLNRDVLKKIATRDQFFQKLTKDDAPALFWYGFNLGSYVNLNRHSVKTLSQASLVEKSMRRVLDLDPGYYHGSAHLFLFAYYASRPPMLGGNLEKALFHYQQLKNISGDGFLISDLFYARYYLTRIQDREGYESVLDRVRRPVTSPIAYKLLNKVAVERAATYLEAMDRLFD